MEQIDLEKLNRLERVSSELEPDSSQLKDWNAQVSQYGLDYISTIRDQQAYGSDYSLVNKLDGFAIDNNPKSLESIIPILKESLDNPGVRPAMPGHLGYIPGGGVYSSALADFIVAFTDHYAGIYFGGPGAVKMENSLIKWMCDLISYPDESFGNLCSGGSIGNLTAIVAARDAKDINSTKVRRAVVYLTTQTHHCVHKSFRIAGLQECILRDVPVDNNYRMNVELLEDYIKLDIENGLVPFMVVGSLGTTDVGAVDPLDKIADIADLYNCWFHIDAAYGGFFVLVDSLKPLFKGVERSDSIVMDPHKTLFLPYGSGAVLVRNRDVLQESFEYEANYMQDAGDQNPEISPAEVSPELTKHFRGLRMWLPLQMHGLKPFEACLEEKHLLTLYFHEQVQKLGFEVGPTPELSVCIYRFIPTEGINVDEFNMKLSFKIRENSKYFISTTTIKNDVWLRAAIVNFRTHLSNIKEYLAVLKEETTALQNLIVKS